MYFLHGSHSSFCKAPLTIWMLTNVSVTDSFPGASVFLVHISAAFVLVVLLVSKGLVFLAVLSALRSESRAALPRTAPSRTSGHCFHLAFGHKESPTGLLPRGSSFHSVLLIILYHSRHIGLLLQSVAKCCKTGNRCAADTLVGVSPSTTRRKNQPPGRCFPIAFQLICHRYNMEIFLKTDTPCPVKKARINTKSRSYLLSQLA